ncbi:MAG TPA: response regulator, partial [Cyanophyceae cyanobacterium]
TPNQPDLDTMQPHLAGKHLLVVDDNATNRKILSLQGESWGMITYEAQSGYEALDWLRQGKSFDLAILDMQMPGMDGLTLAAEIRRQPESHGLPLVMLTSLGKPDNRTISIQPDFAAFLTKPIKQSQLYEVLIRVLLGQPVKVRPSRAIASPIDPNLAQCLPLRILLAEDNVVNQKVALQLLQRMGYRADVVGNGLEVLEALHRQSYDVVFMDVQMPEMDGLTATRYICKERSPSERPWLIAMTANAMQGDREMCLQAGMDDYVSKPIQLEELVRALKNCPSRLKSNTQVKQEPFNGNSTTRQQQESNQWLVSPEPQSNAFSVNEPANRLTLPSITVIPEDTPGGVMVQSSPSEQTPPVSNPSVLNASKEVLDMTAFQQLREMVNQDEVVVRVIDSYLEDAPKLLQSMAEAVTQKDSSLFVRMAHTLKSSSATLGAAYLAQLCQELETSAAKNSLEVAAARVQQVEIEYAQAKAALLALRQQINLGDW